MVKLLSALRSLRDRVVQAGTERLAASGSTLSPHESACLLRAVLTSYLVGLGQGKPEAFGAAMAELAEREARLGHSRRAEAVAFAFDLLDDLINEIGPKAEYGSEPLTGRGPEEVLAAGRQAFYITWFRARAEEDERSAQALAAYAEAAEEPPTIVYSTDRDGLITDISHRAAELLGYAKDELVGQHYGKLMLPDDAQRFGHFIQERRTAKRATRRSKVALRCADGVVRLFEISSTGVYGRDGQYLGTDGIARAAEDQLLSLEYQLDQAGRILEISEETAGALGYHRHELLGQHFSVLMDERERARVGQHFGERRRDERAANGIRVVLTGRDGRLREFEFSAVGRYDNAGEFSGTVGMGTDVTERSALEEQVSEQRRLYGAVFDAVDLGMLVVSAEGQVQEANAWHQARLGRPLAGGQCHRAVFGQPDVCPWCQLATVFAEGRSVSPEPVIHPLDGRRYRLNFSPLRNERGLVVAVVETMHDITDETERARAAVRAAREAAIDRLLRAAPERLAELREMARGSANVSAVLDTVLDPAALSAQGITLAREDVSYLPPVAVAPAALQRVVAALAQNAVEAMPEGGAITVEAMGDAEHGVTLRWSDLGCGMLPEVLDHATEPFFSTRPAQEGLGLAWAAALARQVGGRLSLSSVPGGGTTVELWLPSAAGDEAP